MAASMDNPIIVKRKKKGKHPHHGGAWKIAYADFVTAMMSFFLLLWLISMTTPEQKKGLADYFAPPNVSEANSGAGGVLAGQSPSEEGAKADGPKQNVSINVNKKTASENVGGNDNGTGKDSQTDLQSLEDQRFHSAAVSIKQAWQAMPDITEMQDNLLVEETPEGLNIQIMDQTGERMFPEGSKYPLEKTRRAIAVLAPILQKLPNQLTISGHTAAGAVYNNPRYGSWELSSDRANVTRSILEEFGLTSEHVQAVMGKSVEEPFFPDDPYLAANERVKISVLRGSAPLPLNLKP